MKTNFFMVLNRGSILSPLNFHVFLCRLFYFLEGVAVGSYVDDTAPCSANKTNDLVIKEIQHFSKALFQQFENNYMKMNSGKNHILFSENDNVSATIVDNTIISENKNEVLVIILDSKISFEDHINNPCKKKKVKNSMRQQELLHTCVSKK